MLADLLKSSCNCFSFSSSWVVDDKNWIQCTDKVLDKENYELVLISNEFEEISTHATGVPIKRRDTAPARTKNRHFSGYIYCLGTGITSLAHKSHHQAEISGNVCHHVQRYCSLEFFCVCAVSLKPRLPPYWRGKYPNKQTTLSIASAVRLLVRFWGFILVSSCIVGL